MKKFTLLFSALVLMACTTLNAQENHDNMHADFTKLLKTHIKSNGTVDYIGFQTDSGDLADYLAHLSDNIPTDEWKLVDKTAYWINLYNASVLQLILTNYPVKNIKELGGKVYKVNTIFDKKFIQLGEEKVDLNYIEHDMLRNSYEPRVHFALNASNLSCGAMRNEAYEGFKLEKQLEQQSYNFVNNPRLNIIGENNVIVSKVFKWYKSDFKQYGTIINFLNKYSKITISPTANVEFIGYDWSLNKSK